MAKREKHKIYLAGPMTGCNDDQLHRWRDEVKAKYERDFSFIDPTERWPGDPMGHDATPLEIVKADLQNIETADGLLVNMWRESIGASIGIVHAHRFGRPVVVADPNHLGSRMLTFYADGLENHPCKAMQALSNFLGAGRWRVKKPVDGASEPFDRRKLVESIGAACKRAGCDNLVVPRVVLPKLMERLKDLKVGNQISTNNIDKAVQGALEDLIQDDAHGTPLEGVLDQWNKGESATKRVLETPLSAGDGVAKRLADAGSQPAGANDETASVRISSKKHNTIWGKQVNALGDIPSKEARTFFQEIMRSSGVTEIHLERYTSKSIRGSVCGSVSSLPQQPGLEGKLFDKGKAIRGMQTFRVRVQYESTKDHVLAQCKENLRSAGLWDERRRTESDRPA